MEVFGTDSKRPIPTLVRRGPSWLVVTFRSSSRRAGGSDRFDHAASIGRDLDVLDQYVELEFVVAFPGRGATTPNRTRRRARSQADAAGGG